LLRFVAVNAGIEMHELVLGTMAALKPHAAAMKKNRGCLVDDDHFERGMLGRIRVAAAH
jgi:hypothetical protein